MADTTSASIVPLHQPTERPRPKTPAERARAYRLRKKQAKAEIAKSPSPKNPANYSGELSWDKSRQQPGSNPAANPATRQPNPATRRQLPAISGNYRHATSDASRPLASWLLVGVAFALAAVGVTMNGWFAKSLGSSEVAGWLFLAIGIAADLAALALPACAARQWQAAHRSSALAGWLVWAMTFAFALTAGIGFASVNIADVTTERASRVTPAIEASRSALADAMAARDRECRGGVGRVCRAREDQVTERRAALDAAMRAIGETADPQTDAAIRVVAWVSAGTVRPTGDDFAMVRLILLALLPQVGGILLMVSRR